MLLTFCLYFVLLICKRTLSFNIETRRFVTHKGPTDSKFGFSIAHYKDSRGTWVVVGAPEAETNYVRGITKGGAVYKCSVTVPNDCQVIPFDTKGNHYDGSQYMDDKSHQWFGASVASRSGVVAACAPRYVWYSVKQDRREPIGGCFILTKERGPGRFKPFSPCMTKSWGFHRQGTCQAGFGIALSKGGGKLYVGAVGSWYWQGQIFYQNLLNMEEQMSTNESPQEFDMSYMGYSLEMGNFDDYPEEGIAVGVPRGDDLRGKVVLFDSKLNVLYNISGQQIGSYFGYSIAVLDTDGDGRDDIAIGAPWYSKRDQPLYEEGMVSVFRQTKQRNFRSLVNLHGRRSRAHFGLSLVSLKDLNGDGYEDLAIGAPGDGEEGGGAVYIFMGSAEGTRDEPAQVLYIEKLTAEPIRTFGWTLAAGNDIDGNNYPDLSVGAHESDRVYVFRTRPVVEIEASVKIRSSNGVFDLESLDCSLLDGTSVSCYPIRLCIIYTGVGVPANLDFHMSLQLDTAYADHTSRLFFLKDEGKYTLNKTISLKKDIQTCDSLHIYAAPKVPDKLTPLVAEMSVSVAESQWVSDPPWVVEPILAPSPYGKGSRVKDTIYFQNNCGRDNICIPDLQIQVSTNITKHVIGSVEMIPLEFHVSNEGEDAYTTKVVGWTPPGVHFSKFNVTYNGAPEGVTPFCTRTLTPVKQNDEESYVETVFEKIVCEIGNPLPSGTGVGIQLHFQPSANVTVLEPLSFYFSVNSTNQDTNDTKHDNTYTLELPVVMESDISMRGVSWPDGEFSYNSSLFGVVSLSGPDQTLTHEREIGPQVTHIYDVLNRGPSDLPRVEIYLLWPTRTLLGDPLLYLVDTPIISSSSHIRCDPVPDVNYLRLSIDSAEELPYTATSLLSSSNVSSRRSSRDVAFEEESIYLLSDELYSEDSTSSFKKRTGYATRRLEDVLSCGSTNCTVVKCYKEVLRNNENFIIKVRSRLWIDTIDKLGIANLKISSRLVVHSKVHFNQSEGLIWSESVTSAVLTGAKKQTKSMSLLIWLGSIVIGLLVLALLILMLWMLGFFKRRKLQDESENEPLHHLPQQNGKIT